MILAWGCWAYGKFMKWCVIYPLWLARHKIHRLEVKLYQHARSVRSYWDEWMFAKERQGL